ncbi:MAG: copper chaperone PCu(A)C [Sphingobium sp.]
MRNAFKILLPAIGLIALSACDKQPLYVDQAYVRLSPNPETPSAGYFTVHAGEAPVTLRDVTTEGAVRVEMHDSVMKDGMMSMAPVDSVDIPAKGVLRFEPGGKHLMLWSVNPAIAEKGKLTLTLIFSNGDRILVDAAVQKTGEAAPGNASEK